MAVLNAYYSGDTVAAVLPDESGNGYDGELSGGTQAAADTGVPGTYGIILDPEGYVKIPAAAIPADAWTLSFWLTADMASTISLYPRLAGFHRTSGTFYDLYYVISQTRFYLYVDGTYTMAMPTDPMLVVMEGSLTGWTTVYLNDMVTRKIQVTTAADALDYFLVGKHATSTNGLAGKFDEIALWDGALTEAERTALLTQTPLEVAAGDPSAIAITTADASINISAYHRPQGSISVATDAATFFARGIAEFTNSPVSQIYRCTLTGTADATTDVELPISSVQARSRSGGTNYLSVVVPYTTASAAAIADRPNGQIIISGGLRFFDGSENLAEILRGSIDTVTTARGGRNASISLTCYSASSASSPKTRTLKNVRQLTTGPTSFAQADVDLFLRPGDVAVYDDFEITVNLITHVIGPRDQSMTVSTGSN